MEAIKKVLANLSFDEKRQLINLLTNELFLNNLDKYRTENTGDRPCCPKCESKNIIKNGSQNNVQKFKCKDCHKTFGLLTGTCVHWLHKKDMWLKFIELTFESKSIRTICKEIGINSRQTIFNWRHKLLSSLDQIFEKQFKGVVEIDDMLVRFNQKGRVNSFMESVRRSSTHTNERGFKYVKRRKLSKRGISNEQVSVLFTIDRYRTIDMKLLKLGKINISSLGRVFDDGLRERLNKENIIVTDGCTSYRSILEGFSHEKLVVYKGEKVRGQFHLNTLNNYCGVYKDWIRYNFRSVATKYLQNYLNCFKMIFFVLKNSENAIIDFLKLSLKDGSTFERFHTTEERYQEFLTL